MMNPGLQYPIFGPEIQCPHCRQTIPALTLTDTYLCTRHGAFEANPKTEELVHLQSGRHWRRWNNEWYRQHTHPDGIRFEIHEALDKLYTQGYRATKVIIARRYQELMSGYLERSSPWRSGQPESGSARLYGLPVEFGPDPNDDPSWDVINFDLDKEPGVPVRYPYFRLFE
ncbi:MAG: TIGR02652 family protein [Sphaerospermopsis sp. SIO1G2]|nr:TIGR02652 family protein [Sphaerospermopsis sp. SIO1G1]NET73064.1 TIGR02652 family protein [Sphaerospermopsis sp. SIO1G2]